MGFVTIKSYPNGISLHLDPNADFDKILSEVQIKFEESRKFFKNAKVALSIEDRIVDEEQERLIVKAINEHTDLDLLCIVGKNPETDRKYVKALKRVENQMADNCARIHYGDIVAGEIVESEGSLIVFGDVCKDAAAVATDDVIVFGSIFGHVYAGNTGKKNCFIIAFHLEPAFLSIGGLKQALKVKNGFGKKIKYNPMIIRLEGEKMVLNTISEEEVEELVKIKNA